MNITTYLNIKTSYSLLNSLINLQDLMPLAKKQGYLTLGLCDYDVLFAVPYFIKMCKENNLKAIIGMQFKVKHLDEYFDFVCYVKNNDGYLNLNRISTLINSDNFYLDFDVFLKYHSGLIVCIIFDDSLFSKYILEQDLESFKKLTVFFKETIKDYFIGLSKATNIFNQNLYQQLTAEAKKYQINLVAMDKVSYLFQEDQRAFNVLKSIKLKTNIKHTDFHKQDDEYFKDKIELSNLYDKNALFNAEIISTMCNFDYDSIYTQLPKYQNKKNVESSAYLIALCKKGLMIRLNNKFNPIYFERLKKELNIIIEMKFENYFLIVYDFVRYAKKNNILVGPGRGSAAGSLVSYVLGITDIDPIKYNLLFERFLNPERISMPDIDIDFQDNRRQEVIDYVINKYGQKHVAHIITFGTLKAKQVIRDVGKSLDLDSQEIDRLAKSIPNTLNMNLNKAFNEVKIFKELVQAKKDNQELFELCLKLEGLPRHHSIHAAGIVMSLNELTDILALIKLEENTLATQYQMDSLEKLGLIKMDFLGLKNLSTIQEIVDDIRKIDSNFKINNIELDDINTFKLIQSAKTLGIFQLESSGMMNLIRKMKPKNFNEIAITIALFRPGPMQNIDLYLKNRNNDQKINYFHSDLEDILKETSGIIIYQEQIMQIAQKLAGFSLSKADILRKAMSKKIRSELENLEKEFIDGCIKNGYDIKLANDIYTLILKFADYGFNKSHSIAYALIAYQMAYLKANYSLFFYRSLLNSTIGFEVKTYEYINECLNIDLKIKLPNINLSQKEYVVYDDELLMPLSLIKNVGINTVNLILDNRKNKGIFLDYIDAVCRLSNAGCNIRVITSLIDAGAFDCFNYDRDTMNYNLASVLKFADIGYSDSESIFDDSIKPTIIKVKANQMLQIEKEKEVLGFYFSFNPIKTKKETLNIKTKSLADLKVQQNYISGFGIITKIKNHRTKKGDWMAFLSVEDDTSNIDVVLMPNYYIKIANRIKKGKYIYFEGKMEKENSVLVNRIEIYDA